MWVAPTVEFELAPNASDGRRPTCSPRWTPPTASATARRGSRACPREGGGPALAKARDGMLPKRLFRRNVVLSFQEDAIGVAYAASWITVRVWIR